MTLKKRIALVALSVLLTLSMAAALALDAEPTGNLSEIERTFLAFEKAVLAQLVHDGYVTQSDANLELEMLEQLLSESKEDIIYALILDGALPYFETTMSRPSLDDMMIELYATLTGKQAQDIAKTLKTENITIWQLAEREGNLETMQKKLVELKLSHLNGLVKQGKMSEKERDGKIKRFEEKLKEFIKQQGNQGQQR